MISEPTIPAQRQRVWRDTEETPLMVELPAGDYVMGASERDRFTNDTERPAHPVTIPPGVALGKFPVSVAEFRRFRPAHEPASDADFPVTLVTWHDANAYCAWLTNRAARPYLLPSEAVWEYACRAGSRTPFSTGDEITPSQANYLYDEMGERVGLGARAKVGSYPPNAYGLCDLHGNVAEWVADSWRPNYLTAPDDGSAWNERTEDRRVVRGGAWDYLPRLLRSAWRDVRAADYRADNLGFRVATTVTPEPES